LCGFLLSIGMFYFEDRILIHFQRQKIALVNSILEPQQNLNSSDLVILSDSGKVVYFADYYDDTQKELSNVLIVMRTESGDISTVIKGESAHWQIDHWEVTDKAVYTFTGENGVLYQDSIDEKLFSEPPETFQRNITSIDEMTIAQAKLFIDNLKKMGLTWVITKQHFEITEYPLWMDDLIIQTWAQPPKGFFCFRDFAFFYAKNGKKTSIDEAFEEKCRIEEGREKSEYQSCLRRNRALYGNRVSQPKQ